MKSANWRARCLLSLKGQRERPFLKLKLPIRMTSARAPARPSLWAARPAHSGYLPTEAGHVRQREEEEEEGGHLLFDSP